MNTSRRTRFRLGIAALVALLCTGVGLAVHDLGLFELDGNAVDNPAGIPDDWNQIYCDHIDPDRSGACVGVAASSALVGTFLTDPVESPSDDIFDGAKDSLDIEAGEPQDWHWKVAEPNDKNDIEHAYAAMYNTQSDNSGDFALYFGMDKLSNNGDAAIGFWFLQNDVTQVGTAARANPFSAGHVPGDILVQADITSGGNVGRSDTYTWVAGTTQTQITTNCSALGGVAVAPSQGGLCRLTGTNTTRPTGGTCGTPDSDPGTNDLSCAIMNTQDETAPWPYIFKFSGGVASSPNFPVATFFEAGLNVSKLFPGGIPCFSSFLAETRQSQSETAELEDKLLGGFDLCSIAVRKEGPDLTKVGDTAHYKITITNDGALPLKKVSISDDKLGDLSGSCGETLNPGASCVIEKDYVVPSNGDPLKNTVTAKYVRDTATIDTNVEATTSHTAELFQPSITFDKKAEGSNGPLTVLQGATVDYTLALSNTSSTDTPVLNCTITEDQLDIDDDATPKTLDVVLASGQSTIVNASKTFLTTATPFVNTASVSCSPEGFANVLTKTDSVRVNVIPSDQALTVSKTGPQYAKVGDSVTYTIKIDNISTVDVTVTSISDTLLGDLLATAKAACTDPLVLTAGSFCEFTYARTVLAGDSDPLRNVVKVQGVGPLGGQAGPVEDDHSVDLVHPSFTVTKDCLTDPIPVGQSAIFRIRIQNTGDVNLETDISDPLIDINELDVLIPPFAGTCAVTDWGVTPGCYEITGSVIATGTSVQNTVDVHATLPEQFNLSNEIDHSAGGACQVTGGATRTWGFWKSHGSDGHKFDEPVEYGYTGHVFRDHIGDTVNLGWKVLTNEEQVFGLFWADPSKDPATRKNRDQTCRTALHTSQQLLAAILNQAMTNGSPIPGTLEADTRAALAACADDNSATACNRNLLTSLSSQLAAYNMSGDTVAIVDEDNATVPHADPPGMRDVADYSVSACPKP